MHFPALPRYFYGWNIVLVALLMNIAASPTNAVAFSFFVAPMSDDLGWSRGALSLALTFRLGVAGFTAPLTGIRTLQFVKHICQRRVGATAGLSIANVAACCDARSPMSSRDASTTPSCGSTIPWPSPRLRTSWMNR